jgi:hypothetical protein
MDKNQPKISRSVMIDKLIDTAADIIDSIWYNIKTNSTQPKVMSTASFIKEILKRSRATFSMLQLSLFYLFRMKKSLYQYLQQDQDSKYKGFVCCGRRMFLAALMISSKYLNDRNYRNMTWAKIACLPVQEINKTEHVLLSLMNFELFVSKALYDKWVCLLHQHIQKKDIIYQHIIDQQQQQQQQNYNYHDNESLSDYTCTTPPSPLSNSCTSSPNSLVATPTTPPALTLKRSFSLSFQKEESYPMTKHIKLT